MKTLLIRPPSVINIRYANIPLGLGYIASSLEKIGVEVSIIDYLLDRYDKDTLIGYIRNTSIDLVGLSVVTMDFELAQTIIKDIKESTGATVIVGGPHATIACEDLLFAGADFAVIGEGEKTIQDFVRYLHREISVEEVEGIAFKDKGEIRLTETRKAIQDLDSLPFPAFHLLEMKRYAESARNTGGFNIISSRGCPADCHFCLKSLFGYKIRQRTPENVVKEVEVLYHNYGIKAFCFVDDYFLSNNDWIENLCNHLSTRNIRASYWAQGRVDNNLLIEVLKKMVSVGFKGISFGVESGDQQILNNVGKRITLAQIKEVISKAKRAGFLLVEAGIILGFPWDTQETLERTVQFATDIDTTNVHITFFTPYPGTKIWKALESSNGVKFERDYKKLNLMVPSLTTTWFNEKHLWRYYYRLISMKMKRRFVSEMANIPIFIYAASRKNQSLKQTAYMYFPSMFAYLSTQLNRYSRGIQ
jgi:anaerobic magnesium-protoporphyrin IX monomethyl ester cyclase